MKKLLLASVACGALAFAAPAQADDHGIKLDLGGHLKAYGVYNDQDEVGTSEVRDFDILRETEIHFNGEKTLDNGLTVGVHIETDIDSADDSKLSGNGEDFTVEESYVYFSSGWGRVNLGKEDGAAYLLQVAAPSADSNIDGIRQFIQPVNEEALDGTGNLTNLRVDYDQAISQFDNKLTYITPVFSGFQAGISYTPEADDDNNGLGGVSLDDEDQEFGDIIDVAVRYEGKFDELGFTIGAGYTTASVEEEGTLGAGDATDDRDAFNVGLDMDWGPFGLGVVYLEDNNGDEFISATEEVDDEETLVIGADYTHGPYKLGLSYLSTDNFSATQDLDVERYTGGVVYTYGPGMTFRGSVSYVDFEEDGTVSGNFGAGEDSADSTAVLIGTQIKF